MGLDDFCDDISDQPRFGFEMLLVLAAVLERTVADLYSARGIRKS